MNRQTIMLIKYKIATINGYTVIMFNHEGDMRLDFVKKFPMNFLKKPEKCYVFGKILRTGGFMHLKIFDKSEFISWKLIKIVIDCKQLNV